MAVSQPIFFVGLASGLLYLLTVFVGGKLKPDFSIYQAISELTLPASPNRLKITVGFVLFNILLLVYGIIIGVNFASNFWLLLAGYFYIVVALAGFGMMRFPMDPLKNKDTKRGSMHNNLATVAIVGAIIIIISSTIGFYQVAQLRSLAFLSLLMSVAVTLTSLGAWISALRRSLAFGSFQKASLGLFMLWLIWSSFGLSVL